jgi:hypothetical protein
MFRFEVQPQDSFGQFRKMFLARLTAEGIQEAALALFFKPPSRDGHTPAIVPESFDEKSLESCGFTNGQLLFYGQVCHSEEKFQVFRYAFGGFAVDVEHRDPGQFNGDSGTSLWTGARVLGHLLPFFLPNNCCSRPYHTNNFETSLLFSPEVSLPDLRFATVLEMGAGSGLAGLVAAQWGARHVVLSDRNRVCLALCERNIQRNSLQARMSVQALSWGSLEDAERIRSACGSIDMVLASDVLYFAEEADPFWRSARALCCEKAEHSGNSEDPIVSTAITSTYAVVLLANARQHVNKHAAFDAAARRLGFVTHELSDTGYELLRSLLPQATRAAMYVSLYIPTPQSPLHSHLVDVRTVN